MGGLCQNIQLVLVFFKAPLLDLHFCYYTLIVGGGREGGSYDFLTPPIKTDTPNGKPQTPPPLKSKTPFHEMILEKKTQ